MNAIKKMTAFLLIPILVFLVTVRAGAAEREFWFIKHNGHSRPDIPEAANYISNYNAYYADERLDENSEKKVIYLTFDAGYENGNVERILDVLKEKNVPAAFFVLDNIIIKNTELVLRMSEEGHLVCNHTNRHRDLSYATKEEIERDLSALEDIYRDKTGKELSKYFRFPEGKFSKHALECVNALGYKTIFWSFAYADWDNARQPSEEFSKNKILSKKGYFYEKYT